MFYIIDYDRKKKICKILDSDDMVIEDIKRVEFNRLLRDGIKFANVDSEVVLNYPKSRIGVLFSTIPNIIDGGKKKYDCSIQVGSNSAKVILIKYDKDIFIENRIVGSSKYNFMVSCKTIDRYTQVFDLYLNGYYYKIESKEDRANKLLRKYADLFINGTRICNDVLISVYDSHELENWGYSVSDSAFVFRFRTVEVSIKDGDVTHKAERAKRRTFTRGVGIPMSLSEFKRKLLYR